MDNTTATSSSQGIGFATRRQKTQKRNTFVSFVLLRFCAEAIRSIGRNRIAGSFLLPEFAIAISVEEIDRQTDDHPDYQSQPRFAAQCRHERQSDDCRENWYNRNERSLKGTMQVRILVAQ